MENRYSRSSTTTTKPTTDYLQISDEEVRPTLKTRPGAAKEYLATREYLSMCRQVVADPQLAINLVPEPDSYRPDYVTSTEQKVVDQAINLNIAAMLSRRH